MIPHYSVPGPLKFLHYSVPQISLGGGGAPYTNQYPTLFNIAMEHDPFIRWYTYIFPSFSMAAVKSYPGGEGGALKIGMSDMFY